MFHKTVIILYALIGMTSSIAYFYQQRKDRIPYQKTLMMVGFFTVHLLLAIIGIILFMQSIPVSLIISGLLLAWLSRIGNGVIVFEKVNSAHHIFSACFFGAIFIGYYFHL